MTTALIRQVDQMRGNIFQSVILYGSQDLAIIHQVGQAIAA
jgi:hypothetical protein